MVQFLDYGDPLTARETGEEMSNELAEMEGEDIQRDTRGSTTRSEESQGVQENHLSYFTTNLKHNKPSAAVSITLHYVSS